MIFFATADSHKYYDSLLFYTMIMPTPEGLQRSVLAGLGDTKQGIVLLHHAILGYPEWPVWNEIAGIEDQRFVYYFGETVHTKIRSPDHPITRGIKPWTMIDETYLMCNAGKDSEILLAYDQEKSMKTIAWTRQHRNSPVFCYQAGHDNLTWADANFKEVLRRGILWSAGQLNG